MIVPNLKSNKKANKFFINFVKDGKRTRKVLDYTTKSWDKRTRITKATLELNNLKDAVVNTISINDQSTLNQVADIYFTSREQTDWTKELTNIYKAHMQSNIGKKKISTIRRVDIDQLKVRLEKKGATKQTENGCSPRTIRKILIQCLKPVLEYALDNEIINKIPKIGAPKQPSSKKVVDDAEIKLQKLYNTINNLYKDDPFYRALFLLALQGRRQNEILTLHWNNINFTKNTYTIEAQYNKIGRDQSYTLPSIVKESLQKIKDDRIGLVFKSPQTGKKLTPPRVQLNKIKNAADMPDLTMHKFRHILASYLSTRADMSPNQISATLGHVNTNTTNQYYITHDHLSASAKSAEVLDTIVNTKEE